MPKTIAFTAQTGHQGQTLVAGSVDHPGSCYRVSDEAAAYFVGHMGWASEVQEHPDNVDMTHLTVDPATQRYSDGLAVSPADISA